MIFKCKMCGGTIEFQKGDTIGICDSCGTKQTLPRLDGEDGVTATDALLILQYAVGKIEKFPVKQIA